MFEILTLFGVALSAALFADFGGSSDDADDQAAAAPDETAKITSVSDLLSEGGEAMPGAEALDLGEDETPVDQIIYAGDDDTTLMTEGGNDFLFGGDGADDLQGGAGQDDLHGGRGDDVILGEDGDDHLFGHVGDDRLYGGAGTDTLNGGDGDDALYGGEGDDIITGYHGDDTLYGGAGADMLNGGAGNDVIDGGDDDVRDFLNGGAGDDLITAGLGDHLNGGTGADTFALLGNTGAFIDDFDPAEDVIELGYDTIPPILTTAQGDDGLTLFADGEAVATLAGVTTLDLTAVKLVALPAV